MNSPATPLRADLALLDGLHRWRRIFTVAMAVTAALAMSGFVFERIAAQKSQRSSLVLAVATLAQRALWAEEHAAHGLSLARDTSEARADAARTRAARDTLLARLADAEALSEGEPLQRARLDSLRSAIRRWEVAFIDPILAAPSNVTGADRASAAALDEVADRFDAFITHETVLRVARRRMQTRGVWTTISLVLLSLLLSTVAFMRVTNDLESQAMQTRKQQLRLEEQAGEMEAQARTMEDQAARLKEQAEELGHRVHERDATNRLLEEAASFLDSAVESAPLAVCFVDRELRLLRVNAALAQHNGLAAEEHVGRSPREVMPSIAHDLVPLVESVLRSGEPISDAPVTSNEVNSDGSRQHWRVTAYPLRVRGRAPVGVGVMMLDVTERTHLEEQLRQSAKMEAVGRLAGGIAHDFNNVLTVIQSYTELLMADLEAGAPGRDEIDAIRGAADRAAALARQLLAFTRREVVIPRILDINEVIRGMEPILRRLLRQGIELDFRLAPQPLLVRIDSGQLEQVLMNLAINAVDAMEHGGRLRIATSESASAAMASGDDGPAAILSVTDDGAGISADVRERLFEPFFTTKPAGRGTGLGLATAYAIVRSAGGTIAVTSAPNEGATFKVILPRRAPEEREPESRSSPARGIALVGRDETVLLVEDEPAIRSAISRVLRGNGYKVIEASNGGEALRLADAAESPIDLLLTDVMMPGMGGKELVQRMLAVKPGIRVMLMSGYTDDDSLRGDLAAARYVFLQKPFSAKQVVAAVRELLDAV
ncbi:MAG: ATP-binding protein [Gemmatimonadaceae bacterium]